MSSHPCRASCPAIFFSEQYAKAGESRMQSGISRTSDQIRRSLAPSPEKSEEHHVAGDLLGLEHTEEHIIAELTVELRGRGRDVHAVRAETELGESLTLRWLEILMKLCSWDRPERLTAQSLKVQRCASVL